MTPLALSSRSAIRNTEGESGSSACRREMLGPPRASAACGSLRHTHLWGRRRRHGSPGKEEEGRVESMGGGRRGGLLVVRVRER